MAGKRVSRYTIELDIENGDRVRRSVDDIEKSLAHISQQAKDGMGEGLKDAKKEAESLAQQIKDLAKSGDDATAQLEAYGKAANRTVGDLEKTATRLTYSLSEQGKAQRKRIDDLKKELQSLGQSKEERKKAKEIEKEIKSLQKDIVEGSDDELSNALKQNRAIRATLRLAQQEAKLAQVQNKAQKTFGSYLKDDLKALKEKLKLQFQFISSLKTAEGRYKALKKAAGAIGGGAIKAAKAGAVGIGGLAAGALAVGGLATSSANSQVDREREADRIKGSFTKDEKQQLLGDLYVRTGADYTSIVDAINRVSSVLGNASKDEIAQATATEIRYPGAVAIFRQQNAKQVTADDFGIYQNRMKAIQGATGATAEQIQQGTEKIANMRQSSFSNASMTELLALYSGLQNSGAYDSQEELDRAFDSFVRSQKNSKESVFDHARRFDWAARAYGATNKQQVKAALGNLDFGAIETASKTQDKDVSQTDAEKTAQKMRELEEKRNQVLMKLVEGIAPVLEQIDVKEISVVFDSLMQIIKDIAPVIGELTTLAVKIFRDIQPYMSQLIQFLSEGLSQLIQAVSAIYDGIKNSKFGQYIFEGDSTPARASGGIAQMPSIVGERGPEAIIPLDWSRSSRAGNIINNISQTFSMAGNETTALSLSQVVKTRGFQRAMNSQTALNARLGR